MFVPQTMATGAYASGVLSADLTAGPVDALFFDISGGTANAGAGPTDAEIETELLSAELKVTKFDRHGNATVIVDDVPVAFYADAMERKGGFYDPSEGVVIPIGRHNLTGAARIQSRLTPTAAVAAMAGTTLTLYKLFTDADEMDGATPIVRSQSLTGGTNRLQSNVPNLVEAYVRGAFDEATIELGRERIEFPFAVARALMHYDSASNGAVNTVQIYGAGLLESISREGAQFLIENVTAPAFIVFVGHENSAPDVAESAAAVTAAAAQKMRVAATVNPKAAAVAIARGAVAPAVIEASGSLPILRAERTIKRNIITASM